MVRANQQVTLDSLKEEIAHSNEELVARYRGMAKKVFATQVVPFCYEKNYKLVISNKSQNFPLFYDCETNQIVNIGDLGDIHAMMVLKTGLAEQTHLACFMPEFDPTMKDVKIKLKKDGRIGTVEGFELYSEYSAPKAHIGAFKVDWDDFPAACGWVTPEEFEVVK